MTLDQIKSTIKQRILVDRLELEDISADTISDDEPLFGEGLGLDSVEALDVVAGLKQEFGIELGDETPESMRSHFYSVSTLAAFVQNTLGDLVAAAREDSRSF